MLRKIAENLTKEQLLKMATAQLFSIVYYSTPLWINNTLKYGLWKKLKSPHYQILRIAVNNYIRQNQT